jgi:hypothetical protein
MYALMTVTATCTILYGFLGIINTKSKTKINLFNTAYFFFILTVLNLLMGVSSFLNNNGIYSNYVIRSHDSTFKVERFTFYDMPYYSDYLTDIKTTSFSTLKEAALSISKDTK